MESMGCRAMGMEYGAQGSQCCDDADERWWKLGWSVTVLLETRSGWILTVKVEPRTRGWGQKSQGWLRLIAWESRRREGIAVSSGKDSEKG